MYKYQIYCLIPPPAGMPSTTKGIMMLYHFEIFLPPSSSLDGLEIDQIILRIEKLGDCN